MAIGSNIWVVSNLFYTKKLVVAFYTRINQKEN